MKLLPIFTSFPSEKLAAAIEAAAAWSAVAAENPVSVSQSIA